jgi:organic radical activating enzyme
MKFDQVNLNFFYGYKCNYSCENCFSGSDKVRDQNSDPDVETLKQAIKKSSEIFNVTSMVTLIGGEPFLYWDDRIVPLSKELDRHFPGVRINITTNGQLLNKNIEKVIKLSSEVQNFSLSITRHLSAVNNQLTIKQKWIEGITLLESHPMIVKIHDDHYHVKDNINANIYLTKINDWRPFYYYNHQGHIKPFATNDPVGSMMHGCPGNVCSCIVENKLYKCPTLATLENHLKSVDQDTDHDWAKYIEYPAIDLDNIDSKHWNEFTKTYGKPTTYCDMCNNNPSNNIKWEDRTYPMIFSKS